MENAAMHAQKWSLRRYIREKLLRSDTWLVIAFLALAGWSLDALRMFLEMHGNWQGGLAAFAGHFWYAIPMAAAIFVLSRLKPKVRLLGTAIYDEAGRLLQTQGAGCLEELAAKCMVAALHDSGPDALQGLTLPSGASAYFVRQGGRTIVLSFSGPASPEALGDSVRQLTARAPVAFDVFDGLEPAVAALAANALNSPVKRDVLAYLYRFKLSAVELSDLVYRVGVDQAAVLQALDDLIRLDLVCRLAVCDLTFYQLSRVPEVLRLLDRLFAWQADWQSQLQRLSAYLLTRPQYARIAGGT
jgi:DNA-binding transcriptional ArsR family regulator